MKTDDEWWGRFGHMDPDGDDTSPAEARAIRDYTEGRIEASKAAKRLMNIQDNYVVEGKDWRVSSLIWAVALRFIDKQPALLDLIDAIAEIPERVRESPDMQMDTYAGMDLVEWEPARQRSHKGEAYRISLDSAQKPHADLAN